METPVRFRRFGAALLLFCCGLPLVGCGGRSSTITGKVTYKNQALKGGTVTFVPKEGSPVKATIQEDGTYTASKVPVGLAKISVDTSYLRPRSQQALPGPYSRAPKDVLPTGVEGDAQHYVEIPPQYANPEASNLTLDVQSGPQTHNIDLK